VSSMQSSSSSRSTTLAVVMAIDNAQSCVAVRKVYQQLKKIRQFGNEIDARGENVGTDKGLSTSAMAAIPCNRRENPFTCTLRLLETHQNVKESIQIPSSHQPRLSHIATAHSHTFFNIMQTWHATKIHPTAKIIVSTKKTETEVIPRATLDEKEVISAIDLLRVQYAQATLKLLHMVEFYVLIEFTEVVVAGGYSKSNCGRAGRNVLANTHLYCSHLPLRSLLSTESSLLPAIA
jgi:hypothetical protein